MSLQAYDLGVATLLPRPADLLKLVQDEQYVPRHEGTLESRL